MKIYQHILNYTLAKRDQVTLMNFVSNINTGEIIFQLS